MKKLLKKIIVGTFTAMIVFSFSGIAFAATKFLEPGGDADFAVATTNGFWNATNSTLGTISIATDFVHGGHVKSIKYPPNNINRLSTGTTLVKAGSRISVDIYLVALPSSTAGLFSIHSSFGGTDTDIVIVKITSGGVLQLWNQSTAQIGTNGSTLSTGQWYRLSLAYTMTDTTHNEFRLYKEGVLDISVTNGTLTEAVSDHPSFGNLNGNSTLDFRSSDHYVDDSTALTDTGNIWVTAKRPVANGTANNFGVQIGSGGSGYGTGHSPQVNERALSTTNGWSVVAVAATTEEYNIEGASVGDINLTGATIIDYMGWVSASSVTSETASIVVNNATSNISLSNTNTLLKKIAGSATYPAGTGTDIGIITSATATTVGLYESGIIIAYIPPSQKTFNGLVYASTKTLLGLLIASTKTWNGLQ